MTEITWKARKVRDRAGTEVLGVYSTVAPGSPYVDADLRVGTYPVPNTARADITFTPADASNLAQVEIVADATTELGEHAQATTIARARCGIAGYSWEQIFEYIDRLRRSLHFRGEFEEWHENASRRDRKWIDAFLTWAGGRHPLSREQEQVLLEAVKRGERLPQVSLNDSLPQNPRRLRKPQTPIDLGELPARDEPKKP